MMHPQKGNGFSLILGNILELFADDFATATFLSFSHTLLFSWSSDFLVLSLLFFIFLVFCSDFWTIFSTFSSNCSLSIFLKILAVIVLIFKSPFLVFTLVLCRILMNHGIFSYFTDDVTHI